MVQLPKRVNVKNLVLAFISITAILYIASNIFYFTKQKISNLNQSMLRNKLRKDTQDSITRIYDKPTPAPRPTGTLVTGLKAVGSHQVRIIYVVPFGLPANSISSLVGTLESPTDGYGSYRYLNRFFQEQAAKYNVKDFSIDISTTSPISLKKLNQVGDFSVVWGKDPFAVTKLEDDFDKIINENGIKIADEELVIFLYFDNSYKATNTGLYYETKKFRSFANDLKNRIYINVYNFDSDHAETVNITIAHELLHLFGASDKYIEYSDRPECHSSGLGTINKTGDIMCLLVKTSSGKFRFASFADKSLIINQETAQEIGWKN